MKKTRIIAALVLLLMCIASCAKQPEPAAVTSAELQTTSTEAQTATAVPAIAPESVPSNGPMSSTASMPKPALNANARSADAIQALAQAHQQDTPANWGLEFDGITSRFVPKGKQLALTLDACGGPTGSGVDTELLEFLKRENIPATLFINGRWAKQNRALLKELSENPLFSIQNHGGAHKPLAVTAREAYGIPATGSAADTIEEVLAGERIIQEITGIRTRFFRSGTAHYDDVSIRLLQELGYQTAGFSVNGDGGATFSAAQVKSALMACKPGDIILCHMNRPDKPTGKGLQEALPLLIAQGYEFVRLEDVLPG